MSFIKLFNTSQFSIYSKLGSLLELNEKCNHLNALHVNLNVLPCETLILFFETHKVVKMSYNLYNNMKNFTKYGLIKIASSDIRSFSSRSVEGIAFAKRKRLRDLDVTEELVHIPVMVKEVIDALQPQDNQILMDMTFGAGGHSKHLLNAASVRLICLDRDPVSFEKAVELAKDHDGLVTPLLGRFTEMNHVLKKAGIKEDSLDGILIDAGFSSIQMDCASRGFSISRNGALDMRMDGNRYPDQPTAADVINYLDVPSLVKIFKVYGEEKYAKKIAQALFDARYMLKTIDTTHELADLIQSTLDREQRVDRLQRPAHVATKIFQALRIFVNNELNELNYGMEMAHKFLKPGGRLVTLTFHSLEDRIVKRHMLGIDMDEDISQRLSQKYSNALLWHSQEALNNIYSHRWTLIYKHIIKPSAEEVEANPRSRSAKLRAAIKNTTS